MAFSDIRKQLQQLFNTHSLEAQRIQAALRALDGDTATETPRKKFKMSAARRRAISEGIRRSKAAKQKK